MQAITKWDNGIIARDIVRFQFPHLDNTKASEYVRRYSKSLRAKGTPLPKAPFTTADQQEREQTCVQSREQLNALLGCFADNGKKFNLKYSSNVELWFPATRAATTSPDVTGAGPSAQPQLSGLPACCLALAPLIPLADGSLQGTVRDWPAAEGFLDQLQLSTGATFCVSHQKYRPTGVTRYYQCQHGGKPSWALRKDRKDKERTSGHRNHFGVSAKCGCTAHIIFHIPAGHARDHKLVGTRPARQAAKLGSGDAEDDDDAAAVESGDEEHDGAEPELAAAAVEEPAVVEPAVGDGGTGAYGTTAAAAAPAAPSGPQRTTITVTLKLQHTGHQPQSLVDVMGQPMRPELVARVRELVRLGTPLPVILAQMAHMGREVARQLGIEQPHAVDGRFFPRDDVVRNLVQRCAREQRLHSVDQEAVALEVQQHRERAPGDRIYFRRCGPGERMLFVFQTEEQQRMLSLYGNNIVGMDATYKTSKWGFPLFLLNVVDNHRHGQPVALFFVEEETGEMIGEALSKLREWNPTWQPQHFMVDKSDAEQNAVAAAFGASTRVLLCDFHRLQAWWRWINDSDHGVKDKKGLFHALQNLANAPSPESFTSRLEQLKSSAMWTPLAKAYLETEWLKEVPKWAACHRKAFHGGINTNNYLESMNRVLKHKWLNGRADKRMESLLRAYINAIAPYYNRKYLLDNMHSMRSLAMQRETPMDEAWTCGRPQPVVAMLQLRKERAEAAVATLPDLQQVPGREGVFYVPCGSETLEVMLANEQADGTMPLRAKVAEYANSLEVERRCYVTDVRGGSCTCGDFTANDMPCKHFFMVFERTPLSWADVSPALLKRPHLVIDEVVARGCPYTLQQLAGEREQLERDTDAAADAAAQAHDQPEDTAAEDNGAAADLAADGTAVAAAAGASSQQAVAKQRAEAKQIAELLRGATFDVEDEHIPTLHAGLQALWEAARSHLPVNAFSQEDDCHRKRRRLTATPARTGDAAAKTPRRRSDDGGRTPQLHGAAAGTPPPQPLGGAATAALVQPRGAITARPQQQQREGAAGARPLQPLQASQPRSNTQLPAPLEFNKGKEPGRKKKDPQEKQRPFPLPQLLEQRQEQAGTSAGQQHRHPSYNVGFSEQKGRPNVGLFALERSQLIRLSQGRYITMDALRPPYLPDPAVMLPQQLEGWDAHLAAEVLKYAPQGSALWHALRQGRVTASNFGVFLGLCEPEAAEELGAPAYLKGHAQAVELWQGLSGGGGQQPTGPCLEWGHLHEPNCTWQLLHNLQTVQGFEWVHNTVVLEQGFIAVPQQPNLPPLGASPDGILMAWPGPQATTTPKSFTLEFKSRFAYNRAPDQENGEEHYLYAPHKRFAATMPPTHYAQVQLAMLASRTPTCLYVEYTVKTTGVRVVHFDKEWIDAALGASAAASVEEGAPGDTWACEGDDGGGVAGKVWRAWGGGTVPPENFGRHIDGYDRLLKLTKAGCERATVKKQFESMRGKDVRIFV